MENILEVSPEELKGKAQEIKESVGRIENIINQNMIDHLDDMAGNGNEIWCGVAAGKFEKKYRKQCEKVLGKVSTITTQADNVITVANNYAANEQQNEEIATTLSTDLSSVF